jgi:GH24 family phage-related lysozyme (muramidase)
VTAYELAYLPWCKKWEGCCAWFYLDTRGNVTCGVGFELPTILTAQAFPWYLCATPLVTIATAQEVATEWNRVKAMAPGRTPDFYNAHTLVLKQTDIDAHLLTLLDQTDEALQRDYPGFEGFPDAVKMALADMDYNLGDAKLRNTYPHFDAAVDRQDWATAALQCRRNGIGDARNAWTQQQF